MAETGYNANPNLKPIGVQIQYTEEMAQEYYKCTQDPVYFIDNYCYIVTIDHGLQPFKLYDCQKEKVEFIHTNRKTILMEGRQQGKTTTSAAYILWYTIFNESKNVAILANKASTSREILSRYQLMYENLPIWMQQGIKTWNKGDVELENGSKVFTAATTAAGIRSKSVNLLYIDEAAIIPNTVAEQFFTSVYPTISAGTTSKILITSTPLGYNHFWKFWNDAENGRNDFKSMFIPYWKIPGRDEKWALEQKRQLGDLKYNQEVLCKFLGSALTLINADVIARLSYNNPIYQNEGLDVYEKPTRNHTYVLVADVAKGVGGDYSAFCLMDITTVPYKVIGKYRNNNISPLLYPNVIYKVAKEYNQAYVLLETNISEQVAHILYQELEYENMLFVSRAGGTQHVSSGFAASTLQYGVVTDKKVKRVGCHNFKSLVEENKLLIMDAEIISEISTFIEKKHSYEADDGYHDDLVMCLVLFSWLTSNAYFKDLNNVNLREIMYQEKIKAIEEQLTPFGFYDDGNGQEAILYNF
jgi:hypothetical protein